MTEETVDPVEPSEPVEPLRFFDAYPRFVETSETGHWRERLNARYAALVHANRERIRGARVVDLASHDGRFTFAALHNGAAHVTGIEHTATLVDTARQNLELYGADPGRYDFVVGDIFERIDGVGECDVVFCFGILYHINDHMLLLSKIATLEPRYLIIDSRISQMDGAVIELRSPIGASPPKPGNDIEGQPTRLALDAMVSYFGWTIDYFDWVGSGLTSMDHLADYRAGKRVSAVVTCYERKVPPATRRNAVEAVLARQQDRQTQWLTILGVASELDVSPQALRTWVRRVERSSGAAGETRPDTYPT